MPSDSGRCTAARRHLSLALDGEADLAGVEAHLARCPACAAHDDGLQRLRQVLRFEVVEEAPDVVPGVLAAIGGRRRRPARPVGRRARAITARLVPVAATFVAALVVGALVAGAGLGPPPSLAAALPDRVLAAQQAVTALSADLSVVERGWLPAAAERRYAGTLAYRAPETLHLELRDRTRYPAGAWVRNDVELVIDEDRAWTRGPADCPAEPLVRGLVRREPFPDGAPAPLDLIVPVRSFAGGPEPPPLGTRAVGGGRRAIGVTATAAQLAPLLDGLRPAGNFRALYPADEVQLWLDEVALVPLALDVLPADDPDRALWANRRGYTDPAGVPVLEVRFGHVRLGAAAMAPELPPAPPDAIRRDAGFADTDGADSGPAPGWLPEGMRPHRSGVAGGAGGAGPPVAVRAWADGRAWLKVRMTRDWAGDRLFGGLGDVVRPVETRGGTVYVGAAGTRVGVHGAQGDAVVTGTLSEQELVRVAATLGVRGVPAPTRWAEASSATIDQAAGVLPALLVPADAAAAGDPAVRVDGATVTLVYAGPGARGFVLTQARDAVPAPPLEPDVRGTVVRGTVGRWTPALGELEWTERGVLLSLRSDSLPLSELLAVADGLSAR